MIIWRKCCNKPSKKANTLKLRLGQCLKDTRPFTYKNCFQTTKRRSDTKQERMSGSLIK